MKAECKICKWHDERVSMGYEDVHEECACWHDDARMERNHYRCCTNSKHYRNNSVCKGFKDVHTTPPHCGSSVIPPPPREVILTIRKASLQPCEYCNPKKPRAVQDSSMDGDSYHGRISEVPGGWYFISRNATMYGDYWYKINFCPMCGRDLKGAE